MSSIVEQNLNVLAPSFTMLVLEMYAVSLSHNFYMTLSYNMIIILVYIHFESAQKFLQFQITIHTVGISGLCMTTQCHRLLQLVGFPFSLFLFPGFIFQPCDLFAFLHHFIFPVLCLLCSSFLFSISALRIFILAFGQKILIPFLVQTSCRSLHDSFEDYLQ